MFFLGVAAAVLWPASTYRTRGVDAASLVDSAAVVVQDTPHALFLLPRRPERAGLAFLCGSGVAAEAYVPMLRPLAEAGYPVVIVRLPWRFAPLKGHEQQAISWARQAMDSRSEVVRWVLAGHSLGAALALQTIRDRSGATASLVLIGTAQPRFEDLSELELPVTKVYASLDGVVPKAEVLENKDLLPETTQWVEIAGGNHSQFGNYGQQLGDGTATLSREEQQAATRAALRAALRAAIPR